MKPLQWTIERYLEALSNHEINPSQPFDSHKDEIIEFGHASVSFQPVSLCFSDITPPSDELIERLYDSFNKVLEDLRNNDVFLSHAQGTFGKFTTDDIQQAYLFNTWNKHQAGITQEDKAIHTFLLRVSQACVKQIPAHEFPVFCRERYHAKFHEAIKLWSPKQSSLMSLQKSHEKKGAGGELFNLSFYTDCKYQFEVSEYFKGALFGLYDMVKAHEGERRRSPRNLFKGAGPHIRPFEKLIITETHDPIEILEHLLLFIQEVKQSQDKSMKIKIYGSLRDSFSWLYSNIKSKSVRKEGDFSALILNLKEVISDLRQQALSQEKLQWVDGVKPETQPEPLLQMGIRS